MLPKFLKFLPMAPFPDESTSFIIQINSSSVGFYPISIEEKNVMY
jgi:hypothetical protein